MKKNKKEKFVDDGRTIYSMDVDAKWNNRRNRSEETIYVTKGERKALVKAALLAYFPKLLLVLLGFGFAIVLIYFWLR